MNFDFDHPPPRTGGDSLKWNKYTGRDILPLWVADMDFPAPPPILEALQARVKHGVFGYGAPWPSLEEAIVEHLQQRYDWAIAPEWLVWLPGLVTGLNVACRAAGQAGSPVATATPIYPPFLSAPAHAHRDTVTVPLEQIDGQWRWDWPALDARLTESKAGLFLLCHPHNPVGRAWNKEELTAIGELTEKHDLIVCSDEIHCDLTLSPDHQHQPFASLSPALAARTITLMAPSKTFNIPGLGCAFAVIANPRLRRAFRQAMEGIVPHVNTLGLVACEAALRRGNAWHAALLDYLRGNAKRVETAIAAMAPIGRLSMAPVEATYLAWIDARQLPVTNPQRFFESHGVGLSDGADFGAPGFVRLNFGCARSTLDTALQRMEAALSGMSSVMG